MDLKAIAKHYGVEVEDVRTRGALVKATFDDPGTFLLFKGERPATASQMVSAVTKEVPLAVKQYLPVKATKEKDAAYLARVAKAISTDARLVEAKTELGAEDITKIGVIKPVAEDIK